MPRNLTADAIAQLEAGSVKPIILCAGVFTSGTSYLWSGSGTLNWNGHDWLGVGKYAGISEIRETAKVEAVGVTLSLNGIDPDLLGKALGECRQGNDVTLWFGFVNESTGTVIADPAEAWFGKMDVPTINDDPANPSISLTVESPLIALKKARERRWTDQDQKARYPTDRAGEYVSELQEKNIVWGRAGIPVAGSTGGGGGGGGGMGGPGGGGGGGGGGAPVLP